MHAGLEYAEKNLGVHTVYEEAEVLTQRLEEHMTKLSDVIITRRKADDLISDREMDLLSAERAKHSDLSQAAMDRRVKEIQHKDPELRTLRADRSRYASEVSGLELDIDHLKWQLKVKVARMEELAGYLQYLSALKNAEQKNN